jgi:GxxExxY protein
VIRAFYEVYNTLGFGFREYLYSMALERELIARGHRVAREVPVVIYYKGEELGREKMDMVVDETLVVEVKSTFDLRHGVRNQLYS